MSGSFYNYGHQKIQSIIEDLKETFDDQYTVDLMDDKMIQDLLELIAALEVSEILMQRLDWYLSGDDGREAYHERLKEDLEALDNDT